MIKHAFQLFAATFVVALTLAAPASAQLGRVVTLGDSAATGTGLGPDLPGTPDICNRTDNSYSALAMQQVPHQEFVNEACDGATTWSLYQGWDNEELDIHVRRQFDALEGDEDVVILHVGNNNSEFGDIAFNCLMHPDPADWDRDLCTITYVVDGANTLLDKAASIATSAPPNGPPSVGMAIDEIHETSPNATVFLVGYPRITPPDGAGCRPNYFNLTPTDGPVFGAWETKINETLRDIAADHDAYFVDNNPDTLPHNACLPVGQRWSIPFKELDETAEGEGVPFHTNITGANEVADNLVEAMVDAGLDLSPADAVGPTIAISSPTDGETLTASSVDTAWTITDTAQAGSTVAGVDDAATTCSLAGPSPMPSAPCTTGSKSFSGLTNGAYTLSISSADKLGNTSSMVRVFSVSLPGPGVPSTGNTNQLPPATTPLAPPSLSKVRPSVLRRVSRQRSFVGTKRRRGGAALKASVSEPTIVWVWMERRGAKWTRTTTRVRFSLPAGRTTLHISGNHRGRRLRSGRYRVVLSVGSPRSQRIRSGSFRISARRR